MAEVTFYVCRKCGNLVAVVEKGTCVPNCCGQPMDKLEAGAVEAAVEKHIPVVTRADGKIVARVGEVDHPMLDVHYIPWIALASAARTEIHYLKPGEEPVACFADDGADDVTVYAYCNLHGLWKAEA
jgi:superoxide reductase